MTGFPPEGYPPQNPNQGQQPNPYGQSYQPYVPGQYPPPPTPNQGGGHYSNSSMKNTPAKLSLIFGILIFVCGIFTGIPAIVLGIIGRRKAEELGGAGKTQANVGLGLGIFNLVATVIYLSLLFTNVVSFPGSESATNSGGRSNGAQVMQDDVEVGDGSVEISEDAVVTYSVPITNKTSDDTAFSIDVECDGGGETLTTTIDTPVIAPEETITATGDIQFNPTGSFLSVFCNINGMTFKE